MRYLLSAWLILAGALLLHAQSVNAPWFRQLNIDHGLSHNIIHSICQDSSGYYWLGTQDGLNRFDGYEVKVYTSNPTIPGSLPGNHITKVYTDREGNVWIGVQHFGLCRYVPEFDNFIAYPADSIGLRSAEILDIYQDTDMQLWVGTQGGLECYGPGLSKIAGIPSDEFSFSDSATSSSAIFDILEDPDGNLWLSTYQGLNLLDRKTGRISHFMPADKPGIAEGKNWVKDACIGWDKRIWTACRDGFYIFDQHSGKFRDGFEALNFSWDTQGKGVNKINIDGDGRVWFASWEGTLIHDPSAGPRSTPERHSAAPPHSTMESTIELFSDLSGNMWLGTWNRGALYSNKSNHKFGLLSRQTDPEGLSGDIIRSVTTDRHRHLWIGIDQGGVNRYDPVTGSYSYFRHQEGNQNSLSHDNVRILMYEPDKESMWIGTREGLDRLDLQTMQFAHYYSERSGGNLVSDDIRSLEIDVFGQVWIGTYAGLSVLDRSSGSMQNYVHDPSDSSSLSDNRVYTVYEDRDRNVWIGTRNGLNRYLPEKDNFRRYSATPGQPHGLQNAFVTAVYEDSGNRLWIGTHGGGLHLMNRAEETFRAYTTEDGLPNNVIYGILEDNTGNLWISTNNGLCRFNPKTGEITNFDRDDGLQSNQFYFNAYGKMNDGTLLFGGVKGLNIFRPGEIQINPVPPKINFTMFRLFNKPVNPLENAHGSVILHKHINTTDSITLSHKQAVFTLEFTAIHLGQPRKNSYAYRLDGFEDHWNYVGQQRTATYTNLDAGSYTFRVKAANSDQVWTDSDRKLHITVLPPWWETIWFRLVLALLVVAISYMLFRLIRNREQLKTNLRLERIQAEKDRELDAMRLKFYSNISHEFRTPLTLILGPLDQFVKQTGLTEKSRNQINVVRKNAQRLLRLINQLLDLSRIENGYMKLGVARDDLVLFMSGVADSFNYRAEKKQIKYRCAFEPDSWFGWFDHDKIEKIMYNLLSNAFKFTPEKGLVEIHGKILKIGEHHEKLDSDYLLLRITDTGEGIPAERQHRIFDRFYKGENNSESGTGIGLTLTRQLTEIHKGEIGFDSSPGKGTTFIVKIPVSKNIYEEGDLITSSGHESPAEEMVLTDPSPSTAPAKAATTSTAPILVIDDNPDIRNYLSDQLSQGYTIHTAATGEEGLNMAAELAPALILCDVMMPGIDGFEFCRNIRATKNLQHIPVILLTAKSGTTNRIKGLEAGAEDYIVKPFFIEEVELKIRNILSSRQALSSRSGKTVSLSPRELEITPPDEAFLRKAMDIIESNMDNAEFTIEKFASEIGTSRMQLYRKIQQYTQLTVKEFIRKVRLERAAQLLLKKAFTVSEIAYMVGFREISYFRKCFKAKYGLTPTEYIRKAAS